MIRVHSSDYPVMAMNWSNDLLFINTTKDAQYYDISERTPGRRHIDEIVGSSSIKPE